jgi:hypothetical protein
MRYVVGVIAALLLLQIAFDALMFDYIVHGEVAWRWQQSQSAAFRNSADNYPGYYCGQHNCTLGTNK